MRAKMCLLMAAGEMSMVCDFIQNTFSGIALAQFEQAGLHRFGTKTVISRPGVDSRLTSLGDLQHH